MDDKPVNWMDQAGGLFKQWADQQQTLYRSMVGGAMLPGIGGTTASGPQSDMSEGLRQAQALWQSSMEQWVTLTKQAMPQSAISADSLRALFDPGQWSRSSLGPLDAAIEHLVDGPSYATLWTLDRKILKAQKLRAEWSKDLAAYQVLMHGAWNEAVKRFLVELNDTKGAPITSWRELTDVWVKVANDTLVETHRTPEFLEVQRRLTRSGTECRLQEREVAEAYCEMQQTPTRTEMDEVQRQVYDLRQRLRALETADTTGKAPDSARAPRRGPRPAASKRAR